MANLSSICSSVTAGSDRMEKKIVLPEKLDTVPRATELPRHMHRWNTNEVCLLTQVTQTSTLMMGLLLCQHFDELCNYFYKSSICIE